MLFDADEFNKSLVYGFIDRKKGHNYSTIPQILVNDQKSQKKVLTSLRHELEYCEEFWFSVAFVTKGGLASIKEQLIELRNRKIRGKIIVSQYLNFTQPLALEELLKFDNIEVKIATDINLHSKGYLFRNKENYTVIIGSSNLTQYALSENSEWNLKVSAKSESHLVHNFLNEFQYQFDRSIPVDREFITNYSSIYELAREASKQQEKAILQVVPRYKRVEPNMMQVEALANIEALRLSGQKKALLISATGTGKTFLSAFDVKKYNPKKFLFVVHRKTIAEAAMETYKTLIDDPSIKFGYYSGSEKNMEADFVFCTIQTLGTEDHLKNFKRDHFDYIVIDEAHRSGAMSYRRILDYFQPGFLLGMTATPERTDNHDIFKFFDYNIAYEIRLHKAMEEKMLAPFHYYGISELKIDGEVISEKSDFNSLVSEQRIKHILDKIDLYNCDNGNVRGLVFCPPNQEKEIRFIVEKFNENGYRSIFLTGESTDTERAEAISRIESDNHDERLEYIFTIDIFNEGVDIPKINQVVMLRPTQSAIVFIQQLGRGLRKTEDKEYLTIIDFIGNYSNNYLIPIALYGENSYNKDTLRKLVLTGSESLPGVSTINFDKISKERIFTSIDSGKFQQRKELIQDYKLMRYKHGRIPMMMDFVKAAARDPYAYVMDNTSKSYFEFLESQESYLVGKLGEDEKAILREFNREINNGKRIEETFLLNLMIKESSISIKELKSEFYKKFGFETDLSTIKSALRNLNCEFSKRRESIKLISENPLFKLEGQEILRTDVFEKLISNQKFLEFLTDNIQYGYSKFELQSKRNIRQLGFYLYAKYSRKDLCRIINLDTNQESVIYGYRIFPHCIPLFVTLQKDKDIDASIQYHDHFLSPSIFEWMSKKDRYLHSKDVIAIRESKKNNIPVILFIQKHNGEGFDFYFMGKVTPLENEHSFIESKVGNTNHSVVVIQFEMEFPVEIDMYNYLAPVVVSE